MKDTLYIAWFILTASDAIGSALAIIYLLRLKHRFGTILSIFLAGVAVEALLASASLLFLFPRELELAPAFAMVRVTGRGIKAVCVWSLVLYLFGFCKRGKRNEVNGDARADS